MIRRRKSIPVSTPAATLNTLKRLVASAAVAVITTVGIPAAGADTPSNGDKTTMVGGGGAHCEAFAETPKSLFALLYEYTTVTCNVPVYMTVHTDIRTENFLPGLPNKIVASNIASFYGAQFQLVTRTRCAIPPQVLPGVWGGFYVATTVVLVVYNNMPALGAATTGPKFLRCGNGSAFAATVPPV